MAVVNLSRSVSSSSYCGSSRWLKHVCAVGTYAVPSRFCSHDERKLPNPLIDAAVRRGEEQQPLLLRLGHPMHHLPEVIASWDSPRRTRPDTPSLARARRRTRRIRTRGVRVPPAERAPSPVPRTSVRTCPKRPELRRDGVNQRPPEVRAHVLPAIFERDRDVAAPGARSVSTASPKTSVVAFETRPNATSSAVSARRSARSPSCAHGFTLLSRRSLNRGRNASRRVTCDR